MSYSCLGLASGIGAGKKDCGEGPLFLKENLPTEDFKWEKLIFPKLNITDKCEHISLLNTELATEAFKIAKKKEFFFSFGGDHSSAIGTWSGVAEAYRPQGDIGLLWIDAHKDSHTFQTSDSQNIHGMPLAALLGYGDRRLTDILSSSPKVKPENIALIGIRSYEEAETELLKSLNVKVYYAEEVLDRGLCPIIKECLDRISPRTIGYGVSFDVDAIDPAFVSATGTPVPGGISAKEAIQAMSIFKDNLPLAFELVEYNPLLDGDRQTFMFIQELLEALTKAVAFV